MGRSVTSEGISDCGKVGWTTRLSGRGAGISASVSAGPLFHLSKDAGGKGSAWGCTPACPTLEIGTGFGSGSTCGGGGLAVPRNRGLGNAENGRSMRDPLAAECSAAGVSGICSICGESWIGWRNAGRSGRPSALAADIVQRPQASVPAAGRKSQFRFMRTRGFCRGERKRHAGEVDRKFHRTGWCQASGVFRLSAHGIPASPAGCLTSCAYPSRPPPVVGRRCDSQADERSSCPPLHLARSYRL